PMVVEPDHPDGQEADQVGEVGGPVLPQGVGEPLALLELWGVELEDQQGDGDGEHAVAEGLQAGGGHGPNHPGRARPWPTPPPWVAAPVVPAGCRTGCVRAGPLTWRMISASSSAPRAYRMIPAATSLPGSPAASVLPAGREGWGGGPPPVACLLSHATT